LQKCGKERKDSMLNVNCAAKLQQDFASFIGQEFIWSSGNLTENPCVSVSKMYECWSVGDLFPKSLSNCMQCSNVGVWF
jgi:hypothetical protein